ncbi:MAG: protoporphyrinogen oxidase [Candidatus Binatia bacterium]
MNRHIVVVGGGISGLAATYRLMELGQERKIRPEIHLLEASQRLGGSIATERVGDFLVEGGPDSFISEKPWALWLCQRLGIRSRLISANTAHQKIYVVYKGSLLPLPDGFLLMAPTRLWPLIRTPLFSWHGKLRIAWELFLPRGGTDGDESLASFIRRRLGQEVLDRVAQPLIGGIYATDPERLSLAATMPRFLEMERTRRSIIWAMWLGQRRRSWKAGSGTRWSLFVTLLGGMQELVEAIASRLPVRTVHLSTKATGLEWNAAKKNWIITTNKAKEIEADGLILALPAYRSAEIISALAPELAQELRSIPYSSAATVNLAYRLSEIPHNLDGFGLVVPTIESRKIMACTFSSIKYPGRAPDGYALLRAFVGGALQPFLFEQDDHTIESSVRQELSALLGVSASPLFCRIHRHPHSMPQYQIGHDERIRRAEAYLSKVPALALAGNAYHGVGIDDCIHSGEEAADRLLRQLEVSSESPAGSDAARRASE